MLTTKHTPTVKKAKAHEATANSEAISTLDKVLGGAAGEAIISEAVDKTIEKAKATVEKSRAKAEAASEAKAKKATEKSKADHAEDLVTFAFRIPRSESQEIHAAAGPGKASRFVRAVALAVARGDGDALQKIVDATHPPGR